MTVTDKEKVGGARAELGGRSGASRGQRGFMETHGD